ncbi:nicotinate (nicotinamide) nucleotide adenylyltransferase [Haliangium sp.]|uniref:nicotinate (nicotinamide) nucleotide adenylyltransferase n=1 Tax=Haliangium sp. TaxID=2663208 RepID=UPI003D0F1E7A
MAPTVGLFGGSFNPPHVAHQMVALYVLETCAIDELWMVPTYRHAFAKELIGFEHRCRMCELAAAALGARVKVSAIERELARPVSRTLDTLQSLRERHPAVGFRLVIGADILAESHKWYRWDDIVRLAPPLVVGRAGHDSLSVDMPPVSSTEVRTRLADGQPVDHLVPAAVRRYIVEQGLYR